MTRAAFPDPRKEHALNFEFPADERIQIHTARDDIAPGDPGRFTDHAQLATNVRENLGRQEGDLPLVVFLETKETVAEQPLPRHTLHLLQLQCRMFARRLIVMTEVIVPGRDEKLLNFDLGRVGHCEGSLAGSEKHRNNWNPERQLTSPSRRKQLLQFPDVEPGGELLEGLTAVPMRAICARNFSRRGVGLPSEPHSALTYLGSLAKS
jgi:hypothetical protein